MARPGILKWVGSANGVGVQGQGVWGTEFKFDDQIIEVTSLKVESDTVDSDGRPMYRVRQIKVIPCRVLLISQQRI